ncbi:hypothetical protein [Microbacterium sp. NPDC056234]|uniref:hypothetical protein n=1 Tax=Microbacterium sp. NPDC056234 TaxID=3345757 RepID=UPI0035E12F39
MITDARNIDTALAAITEHWQPRRLTSVNDYDVRGGSSSRASSADARHPRISAELDDRDVTISLRDPVLG